VVGEGRRIRHRADLFPQGTNVDFVEERPDGRLFVRTYERGVEDETFACGTGITACAIVTGCHSLAARGGDFQVDFQRTDVLVDNVHLIGPVSLNFTGHYPLTHNS
jgi:diaminopimelate epimerase